MLYLVLVATTLSMSLVCKSLPIQDELVKKQQLTDSGCEQQEYACLLERNETVRRKFEHSLRVKHGINNPSYSKLSQNQQVHVQLCYFTPYASSDFLSRRMETIHSPS